jgi:uncharacterized GH25 family protein
MKKIIGIIFLVVFLFGCSSAHKSMINDSVKDMRFNTEGKTEASFSESDTYCKKSVLETTTNSLLTGAIFYVIQAQKSYQRCMEEHGFKCIQECKDL